MKRVQAGAALAFVRGSDILVPYYRDLGLVLGIGYHAARFAASRCSRATPTVSGGRQFPEPLHEPRPAACINISSIIAAHCPHAVGAAYAFTYRGETGRAVLCTTGEGATSEGEWHEVVNFAAVHRLPIVFLVENNGFAISTPQSQQMAVNDVARARRGIRHAGRRSSTASTRSRSLRTPSSARSTARGPAADRRCVEAKVYRFLSHSTDDDDRTYRDREEVDESAQTTIPCRRSKRLLLAAGLIDEAELAALQSRRPARNQRGDRRAEAHAVPARDRISTRNVYEGTHEPWQ